mmetsp:Transcript_69012/g.114701  ORF Transcript_69012/g.114701 Transcript_69012/m.114701 type:complete len:110 (+) Transcript_69012:135-464(+)
MACVGVQSRSSHISRRRASLPSHARSVSALRRSCIRVGSKKAGSKRAGSQKVIKGCVKEMSLANGFSPPSLRQPGYLTAMLRRTLLAHATAATIDAALLVSTANLAPSI